jgi:hypothetical protein
MVFVLEYGLLAAIKSLNIFSAFRHVLFDCACFVSVENYFVNRLVLHYHAFGFQDASVSVSTLLNYDLADQPYGLFTDIEDLQPGCPWRSARVRVARRVGGVLEPR